MAVSPWFEKARKDGRILVEDAPKFDLELIESNYSGRPKIDRLLHIGRTSTLLGHDALVEAVKAARAGSDTEIYREAAHLLSQVAPQDSRGSLDMEWLEDTARKNNRETNRLEAELKGYKNNLLKESIRMAYDDTGKHNHLIGNLKEAERSFGKEREFCQTPSHVAIMMFRLVAVYVDRKTWISVEGNAAKLRDIVQDTPDATQHEGILSAITGLAQMSSRNFSGAANSFIDTNLSMLQAGNQAESHESSAALHGIISSSDVATYGALCALASMDRNQLKTRILENANFRQFLEREPHLRRAVSFFVGGKFSQCLALLDQYRADYLLDVNLHLHFKEVFESVQRKAIVQYLEPYSKVTFKSLGAAFKLEEDAVVTLLVDLINSRSLHSRLDMASRTIVKNKTDPRIAAHEEAIDTANAFQTNVQQRCLRFEAVVNGMEIKSPRRQDGVADTLMSTDSFKGKNVPRRTQYVK